MDNNYPNAPSPWGWTFIQMPWWMQSGGLLLHMGIYWAVSPYAQDWEIAYEYLDCSYHFLFGDPIEWAR